jgi:AraC-like DNA-binding protein
MRSGIAAVLRGEKQWSMLAASLGYADQSHLVREFGDMTGLTPGDLQNRLDRIEHDGVNP